MELYLSELMLRQADKQFIWHPYTQMKDWIEWDNKVIVGGEGFYLIDSEGKKFLDGIASMWCNVWGHGNNELVDSMIDQLRNLQHSTLFGLCNGPSVKLAVRLLTLAKGMDKLFYSDNGSTAIEVAMKMALHYWRNKGKAEKTHFISLEHGYHGDTVGSMSVGYSEKFFYAYKPLLTKIYRVPSPFLYESKHENVTDLVENCLEQTENILNAFLGKYSENKQLFHGHTFTGHPLGCAAALTNLNLYKKNNLMQQIRLNSKYLANRLGEFEKSSIVADIRHKGLLAGIELAKNGKPIQNMKNKKRINYFIMHESLKMGVFLRPLGNIMLIIPPLAINRNNLETLLDVQFTLLRKIEKQT
jgi:adenosylmethionine-8-amino-7-oxononanoate aminotransferase